MSLISTMMDALSTNPYFHAGAGLFGIGVGAPIAPRYRPWTRSLFLVNTAGTVGKGLASVGYSYARRRYVVSIELASKDPAYDWFLYWMSKRVSWTQHMSINTSFSNANPGEMDTHFNFLPSVGNHFFQYKGTWIKAERTREKNVVDIRSGAVWEAVTLTMLGSDKDKLFDLLKEAKTVALSAEEGRTVIYTSVGPEWRPFGHPRLRRPFDSVILPAGSGMADQMLGDVNEFLQSPQWYSSRGIPYRRGYLLHGPPGCGKSSYIQALAGQLEYNICILSLSDRSLTDDRLNHLLVNAPERTIILLEDIDAAFTDTSAPVAEEKAGREMPYRSPRRLLNALDGVAAAEGRLLFMTTNHIERLDPALIRPGRVDRIEYVGHANPQMLRQLFERFYPTLDEAFITKIENSPISDMFSMAYLQGVLLRHKEDPEGALQEIMANAESAKSGVKAAPPTAEQ